MRRFLALIVTLWAGTLLLPSTASAQANIAGLVQDDTGAVLPGVTVEASSPALIEKSRSVITDSAGRYSIVDLRPGTYSVVFTLTGFKTVRREGIELSGSGAAQVNASLAVGGVEETLTVTGEAPVVDVQTTQKEFIVGAQLIEQIPVPLRDARSRINLIPGATEFKYGFGQGGGHQTVVHGSMSTDARLLNDGMWVPGLLTGFGEFGGQNFFVEGAQQELQYDTDGQSAEAPMAGIRMNAIPKEGGNRFAGSIVAGGGNDLLQSRQTANESINGFSAGNPFGDRLNHTFDASGTLGGPIMKDRVWFFGAYRHLNDDNYVSNTNFPTGGCTGTLNFSASLCNGQQAFLQNIEDAEVGRITYQVTPRNKVRFSIVNNLGNNPFDYVGAGRQPLATPDERTLTKDYQFKWVAPLTTRLLFDAGLSYSFYSQVDTPNLPNAIVTTNISTGVSPVGYAASYYGGHHKQAVATMSYATGSHVFKAGFSFENAWYLQQSNSPGDISSLRFSGVNTPNSVTVSNRPLNYITDVNADLGMFVQDKWTYQRFTINLGVRFDYFNGSNPAGSEPAGVFVPARSAAEVDNVPNFKNWEPRLGMAWDVFGTGRTAFKADGGEYVIMAPGAFTTPFGLLGSQTETRTWKDLNGDGTLIDASGNVELNEIGPKVNSLFGVPGSATIIDPNFQRPRDWELNIGVDQELKWNLSVSASYHGRWYHELPIIRNTDLTLASWTPFTFTAPVDPRLGSASGSVITQYNLNPAFAGQVNNLETNSPTNFVDYTGLELSAKMRLPHGGMIYGGVTPQKTSVNNCDVNNTNPNNLLWCANSTPYQTLVKIGGDYELPYGIEISGLFQGRPGLSLGAYYQLSNALAGVTLTNVPAPTNLIPVNTTFYDYYKQTDVRVGKNIRLGTTKLHVFADLLNVFNGATVFGGPHDAIVVGGSTQLTGANETYGPNYLQVQRSQLPRQLRFGAQFNF